MLKSFTRLPLYQQISIVFVLFILINVGGALALQAMEPLNFTESFYLAMSASMTSGYGNIAPQSVAGMWFLSFYQLVGYLFLIILITICIRPVA